MTVWQKLFSLQGRLRRRDYWLMSLLVGAVVIALAIPLILGLGIGAADPRLALVSLILVWPSVALLVKRIHDRNKSGWLAMIYWAPSLASSVFDAFPAIGLKPVAMVLNLVTIVIGLWFLIEFGFMDGTQGPNRYGKSPKGIGGETSDKLADVFA